MDDITATPSLLLKRAVIVKSIVTEAFKVKTQEQVQQQVQALDNQMQQLEFQGKRAIAEIEKKTIQPAGPEATQQIESIKSQVNTQKAKILNQKNALLQQLNQISGMELNQEVTLQTNLESYCRVSPGDNLGEKLRVEVVLEDEVIKEIRGNLG
ncbi:YlqD family protein [Synechococcus sp. PCC 7336]|uniref:YlqD family protein n=1 Tax=Synechococcus sp. PCC 7336 TaxID=195250 RepID=UPI000349F70D|nr:YlqD family protein [Synechococcus sp. PCC 7336]